MISLESILNIIVLVLTNLIGSRFFILLPTYAFKAAERVEETSLVLQYKNAMENNSIA